MEFEGQYLNYTDYKALGGTLTQMPFNLLEFESRRQIDIRTSNRLKEIEYENIPQEVKLCEFNLINSLDGYNKSLENASGNNVASESTDGYSVSYIDASKIKDIVASKTSEIEDTIRTYLLGVIVNDEHIMYVGVK